MSTTRSYRIARTQAEFKYVDAAYYKFEDGFVTFFKRCPVSSHYDRIISLSAVDIMEIKEVKS